MDLLILALAAGFILYKFFSIIGERTGLQSDDIDQDEEASDNVVNLRSSKSKKKKYDGKPSKDKVYDDTSIEKLEPHLRRAVQETTRLDPDFSLTDFQQGASSAFEMILDAYAKGNFKTLSDLLSPELFEKFKDTIEARQIRGECFENTLVRLEEIDVEKIDLIGTSARIRVKIISEQIPIVRDRNKEIISGNPEQIDQVIDYWTFERNLRSKNPNWTLIHMSA